MPKKPKKTAEDQEYERKLAKFKAGLTGLTVQDLDRAVEHDFLVAADEILAEGRDAQIEYLFNAKWSAKDVREWLKANPVDDEEAEEVRELTRMAPLPAQQRRKVVAEA